MNERKVVMGQEISDWKPGIHGVTLAAFGPEISGMEFRIDVAFRTCG
jgi:hypothetical protein